MNVELNKNVARALGWSELGDGTWLNFWGASVGELFDFSGEASAASYIVDCFDSFGARTDGRYEKFHQEYHEGMLPTEICNLALKVLSGK